MPIWLVILGVRLRSDILLGFRATSLLLEYNVQQFHTVEWRIFCGERGSASDLGRSGVIAIQPRAPLRSWTRFVQTSVENIQDYLYAKLSAAAAMT